MKIRSFIGMASQHAAFGKVQKRLVLIQWNLLAAGTWPAEIEAGGSSSWRLSKHGNGKPPGGSCPACPLFRRSSMPGRSTAT